MSVDENTAAAFCSFCGASTILSSRIAKEKRPEFIIPFSITKDDCKEAYRKLVKRALFIPKEYKSEKCIDGFRGIYMPYWSYDVKQSGPVKLNGQPEHRSGDYIITKHYSWATYAFFPIFIITELFFSSYFKYAHVNAW